MIFLSRDKIKGEITFLSIYYGQIFYLCLYIYSLQSSKVPTIYSLTNREIRAQNCLGTSQSSPLWRVAGRTGAPVNVLQRGEAALIIVIIVTQE